VVPPSVSGVAKRSSQSSRYLRPLKIPFGSVGADDLQTPIGRLGPDAARSMPDPIVRPTRSPCNGRGLSAVQAGRVCAPGPDAGRGTRHRQRPYGHDDVSADRTAPG
jgi:hypothetical protein